MESDFRHWFFAQVQAFATANSLSVQMPNKSFDGDAAIYLQPDVLPAEPMMISTQGHAKYTWIAQIQIWVRDGQGEIQATDIVDNLRTVFIAGARHMHNAISFVIATPIKAVPAIAIDSRYSIPLRFTVTATR